MTYGPNIWAGVKHYLDAVSRAAPEPVIEKYTSVLAAADIYTADVSFWLMESIRLDLGYGSQFTLDHPIGRLGFGLWSSGMRAATGGDEDCVRNYRTRRRRRRDPVPIDRAARRGRA